VSGGELIKENIPQLDHVIQSYDTAFLKKETADYQQSPHGEYFILMKTQVLI
jgi:hypothetical protein